MLLYTTRLMTTALYHARNPVRDAETTVSLPMRAWPWYCDNNRHINNGVYMTLMDFGRTAWIARLGMVPILLEQRVHFVVGAATMTYRRSIDLMEPFTLETRLHGYDERWFYVEQVFRLRDGKAAVRGLVRGMARRDGQAFPVSEVLEAARARPLASGGEVRDEVERWLRACDETLRWFREDDTARRKRAS